MSDAAACCSCCEPVNQKADAIDSYTGTMAPELEAVRNVGFGLIYETNAPVPLSAMASRIGLPTEEIEDRLLQIERFGRARLDESGNLVGIAGLSLEATPHAIKIDGSEFWTWCALDAVGIFTALGATGTVTSTPPGSEHALEIGFTNGDTDSDITLFIAAGYDGVDVFGSWCPNINFFSTSEQAKAWAAQNGLDGDVLSIPEVSEAASAIWAAVVDGAAAKERSQGSQRGRHI